MFRQSMLAIFRLYMRKLISKLYQRVLAVYRLWGWGGREISFVSEQGAWNGAV